MAKTKIGSSTGLTETRKKIMKSSNWERMGLAAMVPGMQYLIELMQAELDRMRDMLAGAAETQPRKAPSSGLNTKGKPVGDSYWASMTAEERSAEMLRRRAVAAGKRKLHPRDKAHPDHEKWTRRRCARRNAPSGPRCRQRRRKPSCLRWPPVRRMERWHDTLEQPSVPHAASLDGQRI